MLRGSIPIWLLAIIDFFLRGGCNGAVSSIFVATPLAYPTHVRATAHGFHYAWGRVGAIIATVPISSFYAKLMLYSGVNLIAGVVSCLLVRLKTVDLTNQLSADEGSQTRDVAMLS